MPTRITGRKLRIGPVLCSPISDAPQPYWNTPTIRPYVANSESTKPPVAMIGTRSERNTRIMMRNDRPTTTRR